MAPQTRESKRKATEEATESNHNELVAAVPPTKKRQAAKQPAKGKASAKKPANSKVKNVKNTAEHGDEDENEEDFGRKSSKDFFEGASHSEKKKKVTASSTKEEIQAALEKLLKTLEKGEGPNPQVGSPSNMADKLRESLPAKINPIMGYDNYRPNTSFDAALATLGQISETVSTYQSLSKTAPITRPDWMKWEEDHESLVALEEYALRIAARQINSMVIPRKKMDAKSEKAGEVEEVAWEIFDECRPNTVEKTWGGVAMQQFRAFVGLLDGVVGVRV